MKLGAVKQMRSCALALALSSPSLADPLSTLEGSRLIVIDGDTVWLPCATRERGCAEKIRIANIDAPETRGARCEGELTLGLRAKEQLKARLAGRPVTIERCERGTRRCVDPYRRTLAYLATPEGDVGAWMIAQGLAEPWRPGKAAKKARRRAWCGDAP